MKQTELREKLYTAYKQVWGYDYKMIDYCMKTAASACELSNGMLLTVDAKRVRKDFCFGYSDCGQGPDYSEAIRAERNGKSEEYFIRENMRTYDEAIETIERKELLPFLMRGNTAEKSCPLRYLTWQRLTDALSLFEYDEMKPGATIKDKWGKEYYIPTEDDMNRIRTMYEEAKAAHEKKVRSYLKRYGTTKVRTWTYWLDE